MLDRAKTAPLRVDDPFARYGLRRLVNASGTETTKGASPVCPEVIEAVTALVPHSVEMIELQSVACHTIARVFECRSRHGRQLLGGGHRDRRGRGHDRARSRRGRAAARDRPAATR